MQKDRLESKEARLAIAERVQNFLDANDHPRKFLVDQDHHKLSQSTVDKFFQGEFSWRTLTKIEALLGVSFDATNDETEAAPKELGSYTHTSVTQIEGDYLCVRPLFSNPTNLNAYLVHIYWAEQRRQLEFSERSRADAKYTMSGVVHVPLGSPFMYLTSIRDGNVRVITLTQPDDGLSRGIISTLSNPKGAIFIPVASPILFRRVKTSETPQCGIIKPEDSCYEEYQELLTSVIAEEYAGFVLNQNAIDRRRGFTVVSA